MKSVNLSSWAAFKSLVTVKGLLPQYIENAGSYDIFAIESNLCWEISILKDGGADVTEFEASYKSTYNKPLEIKAGPGRPIRTAASPQPINTVQHWKGYKLTLSAGQTSSYIDISFPSLVYVKGGQFYCGNTQTDDRVSVDLYYGEVLILPTLLDTCYLVDNMLIPFVSPESMALAPEFKLRVTFSGTTSLSARSVYALLEYYV